MIGIIVWAGANECDLIEIDVASREALAQVSKIQMKTYGGLADTTVPADQQDGASG